MHLNELEKSTEGVIPPTDSRLRPDIRALENGDIGMSAESEKVPKLLVWFLYACQSL